MFCEINTDIVVSIIAGSLLLFSLCVFIVAFSALYLKRRQQYKIEKQELHSKFSQALLQSQLEIKEQTLQHIAYELHDNLGQTASLIKINLNTLQLSDTFKTEEKINDTKGLVRQLLTDLKSLSVSLNSDWITQQGIVKSLENEVERINRTGQFESRLEQEGVIPLLDDNTMIILYRMTQEMLNNAVKHSEAKRIILMLRTVENLFTLACKDDGVGFDLEVRNGSGSGLMNLQNRARLINARLTIQSSLNKGTTITIELPLHNVPLNSH